MAIAPPDLRPMLASLVDAPLTDPQLVYEPKYDGIRAIAEVEPPERPSTRAGRSGPNEGRVRLWSRLGNDKTGQFPEIVAALHAWGQHLEARVVLDGEIVALDARGEPSGFQQLQGRIHRGGAAQTNPSPLPAAFIAFDVLRDGRRDLRDRPLTERRTELERLIGRRASSVVRISESVRGDGRALYERALASGWEGLVAKHADSRYKSGKRTPDWHKLKIVHEQEFVIGGWTEPRQSRSHFGALLLGVYEPAEELPEQPYRRGRGGRRGSSHSLQTGSSPASPAVKSFVCVGHAGTGFDEHELARVMKLLTPIETTECPFREQPKPNERPHWVKPVLVANVKFSEWTADGNLRQPVYLGLRDDKKPEDVHRERVSRLHAAATVRLKPDTTDVGSSKVRPKPDATKDIAARPALAGLKPRATSRRPPRATHDLVDQLRAIESSRRDGDLLLPDGDRLHISNLHKVFWPKQKLTKGDLFRYYAEIAPSILPVVADRPLVMKRLPNGIDGQAFYQQRAPDEAPAGVRVETVAFDKDVPSRLVGGHLKTLLYMTQLAAISQDPWFSRVASPDEADYVALDLDPPPGVPFERVLDVARWIRDELEWLGAIGVPKTSGADGLHVYVPLPAGTPYEAGLIFCQIIATVIAERHPRIATVERSVRARGARVYVDYLQNILGKTLATAYSARASDYAGVSTPLTWHEVDEGVRREDFTIETVPARVRTVGDLWAALRTSKGVDLSCVSKYAQGLDRRTQNTRQIKPRS